PLVNLFELVYTNTYSLYKKLPGIKQTFKKMNEYDESESSTMNWNKTVVILKELRDLLTQIQRSSDSNLTALNIVKKLFFKPKSNPIVQLMQIAKQSPQPIRKWLMQISKNTWDFISLKAYARMDQVWQKKVLPIYKYQIQSKYPFNRHSIAEVKLKYFNNFFAYNGILQNYFKRYIRGFLIIGPDGWKIRKIDDLTIKIPEKTIKIFRQAQLIRKVFFSQNVKQMHLRLDIKPYTLDKRLKEIYLNFGDKQIIYRHGPRENAIIDWPFEHASSVSSITMEPFAAYQYHRYEFGTWSLLRILDFAKIASSRTINQCLVEFDIHGYFASFIFQAQGIKELIHLIIFRNFYLPRWVVPTEYLVVDTAKNSKL
ncbi:MAG: type VI secretion IcmF C-terminal domain-containing protein, partial [Pseudomonadota bacterium]